MMLEPQRDLLLKVAMRAGIGMGLMLSVQGWAVHWATWSTHMSSAYIN